MKTRPLKTIPLIFHNVLPIFTGLVFAFGAAGCSSIEVRKDRVSAVKKIAVIGFSVEQERTNDLHISWTSGGEGWKAGARESKKGELFAPGTASHIIHVYRALGTQLSKDLGLVVLEPEKVISLGSYQAMVARERATSRWVSGNAVPLDFFSLQGVASSEKADSFTMEERRQLLKELGVDALAIAVVRIRFEKYDKLTVGSISLGSYIPSAQTRFALYDGRDDAPIWNDYMAIGERLDSGVFQTSGITNEELLYRKAVLATESSFKRLAERFRLALSE